MKEAFLYEKLSNNKVQRRLCNHFCKALLINRTGFLVNENSIENNRCTRCGKKIPGRWNV